MTGGPGTVGVPQWRGRTSGAAVPEKVSGEGGAAVGKAEETVGQLIMPQRTVIKPLSRITTARTAPCVRLTALGLQGDRPLLVTAHWLTRSFALADHHLLILADALRFHSSAPS